MRVASAAAAQTVAAAIDADTLELINDLPHEWTGDGGGGTLSVHDLAAFIESSVISGRQVGVAAAAVAAIASGVDLVRLGDIHALRREVATEITA